MKNLKSFDEFLNENLNEQRLIEPFSKVTKKVYTVKNSYDRYDARNRQDNLAYHLKDLGFDPKITIQQLIKDPKFKDVRDDFQEDIMLVAGVKGKYAKFNKEFIDSMKTFGKGIMIGRYDDTENAIYQAAALLRYQKEGDKQMILWTLWDGIEYSTRKRLQSQYGSFSDIFKNLTDDEVDHLMKFTKGTVNSFTGRYFGDYKINEWIKESIKSEFRNKDTSEEYYFAETDWKQKPMTKPFEFIKGLIMKGDSIKWDTLKVERKMLDSEHSSVVSSSFSTYYYYSVKLTIQGKSFNMPKVLGGSDYYSGGWN